MIISSIFSSLSNTAIILSVIMAGIAIHLIIINVKLNKLNRKMKDNQK